VTSVSLQPSRLRDPGMICSTFDDGRYSLAAVETEKRLCMGPLLTGQYRLLLYRLETFINIMYSSLSFKKCGSGQVVGQRDRRKHYILNASPGPSIPSLTYFQRSYGAVRTSRCNSQRL
jgi:hypothetical protein